MKFENQTFENVTVSLDCNEFIDCELKNCVVTTQGGPYELTRTSFDSTCTFAVTGAGLPTLAFLRLMRDVLKQHNPRIIDDFLDSAAELSDKPDPTKPKLRAV
jgi:hypothetical protein